MKPTSNYKMSKQAKRYLATILDPHKRGQIKKGIIDSELTKEFQPRRSRVAESPNDSLTD